MIRIDEIYDNIFTPIVLSKPKQSMHYFDPFGRTDVDALTVKPLIQSRNKMFLFWDQEPFFPEIHNEVIEWFLDSFISKHINCTPKVILITSEKNSKNINNLCGEYAFEQAYYFFHAWASLDWYRGYNRTFLIPEYKNRNVTNTFICPNRIVSGKREHRIDLFKNLVQHNLVTDNKVSFPKYCPYNNEEIKIPNITLPLVFDNEEADNIPNESYKISLWEQAKESLLYVVTETVFKEETLHLTEKTFKPIVMQMPFILVGTKHSLEYLRSYGFKTFGEFWNEDYDNQNNEDRLISITNLINELNSLSLSEQVQLQKHIAPLVEHNFKWFYSKEFENLLWNELTSIMKEW